MPVNNPIDNVSDNDYHFSMPKSSVHQDHLPVFFKKSNEFVRARLDMDRNELAMQILMTAVRHASVLPTIRISLAELGFPGTALLGGSQWKQIRTAIRTVARASVIQSRGNTQYIDIARIIKRVTYKDAQISVQFDPELMPHIGDVKKFFTELNWFDLEHIWGGDYNVRIYELLKSWAEPYGIYDATTDELMDILAIPKSKTNNTNYLITKLSAAQKALKATDLRFNFEIIEKQRKKITKLRFNIAYGAKRIAAMAAAAQTKVKDSAHDEARRRHSSLVAASSCRKRKGVVPDPKHPERNSCPDMAVRSRAACRMCREAGIQLRPKSKSLFD